MTANSPQQHRPISCDRAWLRLLLTFLVATLPALSSAANDESAYQRYLTSIRPQPSSIRLGTRQVRSGELIVGFAMQDKCESEDSSAVLFVVLKKRDGTIEELGRTPFFDFPACSKVMFEAFDIQSDSRFWVQFRHGFNSTEIYHFAHKDGSWRVAGRQYNYIGSADCDKGVGDSRTQWSGNFLTGHAVKRTYRCNRLVDKTETKAVFPKFPLGEFILFSDVYGPR